MFVSYRWLSRHVDLTGIGPEQLAEDLTMSTAEVEGVEPFLPHMADVTVGFVQGRYDLASRANPFGDLESQGSRDVGLWKGDSEIEGFNSPAFAQYEHVPMAPCC